MRRAWLAGVLLVIAGVVMADDSTIGPTVIVYGKADGATAGWGIVTNEPAGWTQDCCHYAKAIGVNLVLYRGDWTGDPDRVMVLNVWPSKRPSLADEVKEDRAQYLHRDSKAAVSTFAIHNKAMSCVGTFYKGSDHMNDAVVFCEPGKPTGIRLSWSVTIAANDPNQKQTLSLFRQVVERSLYMKYKSELQPPAKHATS